MARTSGETLSSPASASTTPLHFWGALQGANLVDGSLARFIILPSDEDYPDENRRAGLRKSPRALIEGLQRLAEGGGGTGGNLAGQTSGLETTVDPMTVPMDEKAQARFDALGEETTVELRAAAGTSHTPILARIAENAAKVALVMAWGGMRFCPSFGLRMPSGPSISYGTSLGAPSTPSSATSPTPRPRRI